MLELKVLVGELFAIDALSTCTVACGEVTTLNHELLDNAVEVGALEVEGFASLANSLLACAKSAEILGLV